MNLVVLMKITNTWQFWSIIAIVLLIAYYLTYRVALIKSTCDFSPPVIFQLVGALAISPLALLTNEPLPFMHSGGGVNLFALGLFALSGVFYAIHDRAQGSIRKNVDVAVSGVIDLSHEVFLIIFGVILLKNILNLQTVLGIVLIMVANFSVVYDFESHRLNKYWALGLFANICMALGIMIDMNLSSNRNLPLYLALNYLWVVFLIVIMVSVMNKWNPISVIKKISEDFNRKNWYVHLLSGVFSVYEMFAMYMAFRRGPASVVAALMSSTVIFNTILAALFLRERSMLPMKIIASIVGVVGIILLIIDV